MSKISTSDFQKGMFIEFKNEIQQIISFQHVNPGKGSAFVRTRLKSLNSGKVLEYTFKSGESVEQLSVHVREMQFLYKQQEDLIFMDNESYEQLSVQKAVIGPFSNFLKEGATYQMLIFEEKLIGMRYPKKVQLKVIEAPDAVKGNTVIGGKKEVTLETGVTIQAPLFIKIGDMVSVDPESGEYQERIT
jgi:elongation factor P